jgi:hypothetical protein
MPSHTYIDMRSLAMHRLVVEKIRHDPALFAKVRLSLTRWRGMVCLASQPYLQAWEALANQGIEACLQMALEDSQYATALRQSSPFVGILTDQERFAFLKSWKLNATHRT